MVSLAVVPVVQCSVGELLLRDEHLEMRHQTDPDVIQTLHGDQVPCNFRGTLAKSYF